MPEGNLVEVVTHEMIEHYQRVMDGDEAGDPGGDDVRDWRAKFRPATHAKPMPAGRSGTV